MAPKDLSVNAFAVDITPGLLRDLPLGKLRSLGGKFGEEVQQLVGITTAGELAATARPRLDALFGEKTASRIARLSVGLDDEEVRSCFIPVLIFASVIEVTVIFKQCVAEAPWWLLFQIWDCVCATIRTEFLRIRFS